MNTESVKSIAATPPAESADAASGVAPEPRAKALLQAGNFDELNWLCAEAELSEAFLLELCQYPELHGALAHRKGPISVLNRMAEESEFSEAAQTLGQIHYREAIESTTNLTQFLVRHHACRDLFERLIRDADLNDPRLAVVLECMRGAEFEADLILLLEKLRLIEQARSEIDAAKITAMADTHEPRVLLEIARNPHTPKPLLRQLTQIEPMKFCRQIRAAAKAQLDATTRTKS